MLIRDDVTYPVFQLSKTVIITTTAVSALFFGTIIGLGLKAQKARVVTGTEGMLGETGEAITPLSPSGTVQLNGELWNAEVTSGAVEKGDKVRVTAIRDFLLLVEKA
jgi:membrane-bound serine protease (ClpP class)